jgi:hypothetical protein
VAVSHATGHRGASRLANRGGGAAWRGAKGPRERGVIEGRDSGGGEESAAGATLVRAQRAHETTASRRSIAGLDVPLKERRGVAPAGSVLEVEGVTCTLPDGAVWRGAASSGPALNCQERPASR